MLKRPKTMKEIDCTGIIYRIMPQEFSQSMKYFDDLTEKDLKYIKWDISKKTMTRSAICVKWNIPCSLYFRILEKEIK